MPEVMLDLETMGVNNNAAIIAIGAVVFDLEKGILGKSFYYTVDLQSSVDAGGVIDPSTVLWWMGQSNEAGAEFERPGNSIQLVLNLFSAWVPAGSNMWGNGATADNVWLRSAYERLGLTVPWHYRNDRCFRTVKAMHPPIELEDKGVKHNALADARWQAQYLIKILGNV